MLVTIHVYHCLDSITFSFDSRMFISHVRLIFYKNDCFDTSVTAVVFISVENKREERSALPSYLYVFVCQSVFICTV